MDLYDIVEIESKMIWLLIIDEVRCELDRFVIKAWFKFWWLEKMIFFLIEMENIEFGVGCGEKKDLVWEIRSFKILLEYLGRDVL